MPSNKDISLWCLMCLTLLPSRRYRSMSFPWTLKAVLLAKRKKAAEKGELSWPTSVIDATIEVLA